MRRYYGNTAVRDEEILAKWWTIVILSSIIPGASER